MNPPATAGTATTAAGAAPSAQSTSSTTPRLKREATRESGAERLLRLANLCAAGRLAEAQQLYDAVARSVPGRAKDMTWLWDAFVASLAGDRARCALWLSKLADMGPAVRYASRLFWTLAKNNSVDALRWLLRRYSPEYTFVAGAPDEAAAAVRWLSDRGEEFWRGRADRPLLSLRRSMAGD